METPATGFLDEFKGKGESEFFVLLDRWECGH